MTGKPSIHRHLLLKRPPHDPVHDCTRRPCGHPTGMASMVDPAARWAASFVPLLANAKRPVRILSPCAGLNAPERAARELGMAWSSVGDWEINMELQPALHALSQNHATLHIGPTKGNVCNV
eukprot:4087392-Lingulodinium_polyedra.AAC.1